MVFLRTVMGLTALILGSLILAGCSTASVRETVREHRMIVRPGTQIAPRPVEGMTGTEPVEEDYDPNGDSLMLIFRGRI